MILFFLRL